MNRSDSEGAKMGLAPEDQRKQIQKRRHTMKALSFFISLLISSSLFAAHKIQEIAWTPEIMKHINNDTVIKQEFTNSSLWFFLSDISWSPSENLLHAKITYNNGNSQAIKIFPNYDVYWDGILRNADGSFRYQAGAIMGVSMSSPMKSVENFGVEDKILRIKNLQPDTWLLDLGLPRYHQLWLSPEVFAKKEGVAYTVNHIAMVRKPMFRIITKAEMLKDLQTRCNKSF
jgi:hypothetical protein